MIYGIGMDLVEISRMEKLLSRYEPDRIGRILGTIETAAFSETPCQASFLAKRFAAKEAFAKALGTGIRSPLTLSGIQVSHDALGKPFFILSEEIQSLLKERGIRKVHLSLSDEKNMAGAFVVMDT